MFGFKKKYDDFVKPEEELKANSKRSVKSLIDGSILTRTAVIQQLPFVLFLVLLAIFYIRNRYHSEKIYREIVTLEKELKNFRFETITTSSDLMYMSKQSEIFKRVQNENLGLHESLEPPMKIYLKRR